MTEVTNKQYILAGKYSSGPLLDQPMYFRFITIIGPCATPNISEAERFNTRQEAMESPAFSHWSSFYEPEELQP